MQNDPISKEFSILILNNNITFCIKRVLKLVFSKRFGFKTIRLFYVTLPNLNFTEGKHSN